MTLQHTPILPPRPDTEEVLFAARWLSTMEQGRGALDAVLEHYPHPIEQREAHVAASFIVWLGTHAGKSFLGRASALCRHMPPEDACVAAWAVSNRRKRYVNFGTRMLEHCVADRLVDDQSNTRLPGTAPSVRDYEVVEHVAAWIGSPDGQGFIRQCELDCERANRERRLRHRAESF